MTTHKTLALNIYDVIVSVARGAGRPPAHYGFILEFTLPREHGLRLILPLSNVVVVGTVLHPEPETASRSGNNSLVKNDICDVIMP